MSNQNINEADDSFSNANFPKALKGLFEHALTDETGCKAIRNLIAGIAANLNIAFVEEKETGENVCFANSEEVRPEFRQTFTALNVFDYISACRFESIDKNQDEPVPGIHTGIITIPENAVDFWRQVKTGSRLRQTLLYDNSIVENFMTSLPCNK